MNRFRRLLSPLLKRGGQLVRLVGRRGAFLLFLAFLDLVIALSLFYPAQEIPAAYRGFLFIAPLPVWGWAWLTVGLVAGVSAFLKNDAIAFALCAFIKVAWAAGYFLSWLYLHAPRAYLAAAIYVVFALVVLMISGWPESPIYPGDYLRGSKREAE